MRDLGGAPPSPLRALRGALGLGQVSVVGVGVRQLLVLGRELRLCVLKTRVVV